MAILAEQGNASVHTAPAEAVRTVTRRGLWGAMRVFHQMRVQVAALALGTGAALTGLVAAERPRAARTKRHALTIDDDQIGLIGQGRFYGHRENLTERQGSAFDTAQYPLPRI